VHGGFPGGVQRDHQPDDADDPAACGPIAETLLDAGHDVLTTADALAALDYVVSAGPQQPDAIVLDLYLPRVDG
jgi:DNA-binding response OmpR family regulator